MSPRATPTRAWGKRQWVRLFASIIGLAMVAGSSWYVLEPQYRESYFRHGIGGRICDKVRPVRIFNSPHRSPNDRSDECIVLERPGEFYDPGWAKPTDANADLQASLDRGERAWFVTASQWHRDSGVWARTRRRMGVRLSHYETVGPYNVGWDYVPEESLSQVDAEALRIAALHALGDSPLESLRRGRADLIADQDWIGVFPLWSGYLLNIATLLGLGMFLWFTPLTIRDAWRAWRFRGITTCKSCGYDLRGLPDDAPACPECGNPRSARGGAGETSPAS